MDGWIAKKKIVVERVNKYCQYAWESTAFFELFLPLSSKLETITKYNRGPTPGVFPEPVLTKLVR